MSILQSSPSPQYKQYKHKQQKRRRKQTTKILLYGKINKPKKGQKKKAIYRKLQYRIGVSQGQVRMTTPSIPSKSPPTHLQSLQLPLQNILPQDLTPQHAQPPITLIPLPAQHLGILVAV